jgi:hypothetical protein
MQLRNGLYTFNVYLLIVISVLHESKIGFIQFLKNCISLKNVSMINNTGIKFYVFKNISSYKEFLIRC